MCIRDRYYVEEPEALRGKWKEAFARSQPLHLELGCGKGVFTAAIAASHPEINYLAIDISPDVLGVAKRNIDKEMEMCIRDRKRIGLLTSGGDCQGLNAALHGVAKALYEYYDKDVEPVSYTHLDVYKRQILGSFPIATWVI